MASWALAMALVGLYILAGTRVAAAATPVGSQPFTNHRSPPSYRKLSDAEFARYDFGQTVFNTQFVVAGTPNAGRRDGIGPLFNSASCDSCHNNGARGRGPTEDGPAPTPLVVQLTTPSVDGRQSPDPPGDPVYGRVLNTVALEGVAPEGVVMIRYEESTGRYPDGATWSLRVPHYTFTKLRHGPLAPQTIVKPRLAPALFGVGLLDAAGREPRSGSATGAHPALPDRAPAPRNNSAAPGGNVAVPHDTSAATGGDPASPHGDSTSRSDSASPHGDSTSRSDPASPHGDSTSRSDSTALSTNSVAPRVDVQKTAPLAGRGLFGWQASALSVRDQTARAFAREMGLTSADIGQDDCTPVETDCLHQPNGGTPEISADLFDAVLSFQRWLAVPASPSPHPATDPDAEIFANLGCAACHEPLLPVTLADASEKNLPEVIAPYTDLRLHDLGDRLADENVAGRKVASKWRTAPLWGLGYRMSLERFPTFLHDGRARSAEEAILWHDGEAASARHHFESLPAPQRKAFLHWLETL